MVLRIALAVLVGGAVGLTVGLVGKSLGGQCPLACNPYVSTGLGVVIALILAGGTGSVDALPRSRSLLAIDSDDAYRQAVSGTGKVTLVEFYTRYCPACRQQLPVLNVLADRFAGRAAVATVNASELSELAGREGISAVPTILVFRDGRRVETVVGFRNEPELTALLERHSGRAAGTESAQAADGASEGGQR
jgi:thiol-disulfide isomerase/thioredoxin